MPGSNFMGAVMMPFVGRGFAHNSCSMALAGCAEKISLAEIDLKIEDFKHSRLGFDFFDDQIDAVAFEGAFEILKIDILDVGRITELSQQGFRFDFDEFEMQFRKRHEILAESRNLIQ